MTNVERSYPAATGRLVLLSAAMFVVGTNAFVIAGLLPQMAGDLGVGVDQLSLAITYYALIVAVGAPAISILLARVPRGVLMASGLAVFTIGAAIAAAATSALAFDLGRALAGVGGAALVPTATATAASLVPPERRGRALALVGVGFTLATAVGAPFGTALGGLAGWRTPLWIVVASGAVLAIGIAMGVRRAPMPAAVPLRRRFAPLVRPRVLTLLGTTALMIAGFNVVYIFSSAVTKQATGGDAGLLAGLLLSYGVAGVVGNAIAGPLTDRLGSRTVGLIGLGAQALVLAALPLVAGSLAATAVLFAVWGVTAFASVIPVQHRLVAVDPELAGQSLSWYSTAMYLGIAIAPIAGAAAVRLDGGAGAALVGACAAALAGVAFLASWAPGLRSRRSRARVAPAGGA